MHKRPVNFLNTGIAFLLILGVLALVNALSSPSANANQPLPPMDFTIPHAQGTMLTSQQVRQYVASHSFWVGPTVSGQPFTIQTVQLMTAQQAYQQKKADYLGVPLNEPVYYVVAVGPFKPVNISGPHIGKLKPVPSAFETWDALSGNLLEEGL